MYFLFFYKRSIWAKNQIKKIGHFVDTYKPGLSKLFYNIFHLRLFINLKRHSSVSGKRYTDEFHNYTLFLKHCLDLNKLEIS